MSTQKKLMTNWRWWICSLLFVATTVNYLDRQVLSLTAKEFIYPDFHWTDADYGIITSYFSLFYAFCTLFVGKFVDWIGTKKGYLIAIGLWSTAACLHAFCGVATQWIHGYESLEAMRMVEDGTAAATAIASTGVWLFLCCRGLLGLGESGNFPAAIKVTAEYFPKKDRAFATSIFNSGASVGALIAPLVIPPLAKAMGWEWAFIIIGALGFIWMGFFVKWYDKPEDSKHVNAEELAYIQQDDQVAVTTEEQPVAEQSVPFLRCLTFKQTWSFCAGKFFSDGVWWFMLFWAPNYFQDVYGYKASSGTGMLLIMTLYFIVTFLSIALCKLPNYFVDKKGMEIYSGRMRAMFLIALIPLVGLLAQPLGAYSAWWPAIIIGLVGAGHQAWSANIFSTIGDMFPKSAVATIVGIGTMAGGISSFLINWLSGKFFVYAENLGSQFSFMGFEGKPAAYFIVFCICAVCYLVGWTVMKTLVPKYKPIVL
ncbi:MAG: MFS transporter [Bacteroidales bacterium]|nr:MFS transporter [Bacteroidales bacterium]